jgi:hypothetical protein
MSEGATEVLKKRKHEHYSNLIGRYLMDSEMKFREFFSFKGHFPVY